MATATCRRPRGAIGEVRRLEQRRQVPGEVLAPATSLPREAAIAFRTVSSLCSVQLRADADWPMLRRGIVELTRLPRLQGQLIHHGRGGVSGSVFCVLSGAFQRLPMWRQQQVRSGAISAADAGRACWELAHLNGTIGAAADLAAGHLLHDAGQLVLHHRRQGAQPQPELLLSFRQSDGVMTCLPERNGGGRRLGPSSVRSMRAFVRAYSGPLLSGKLSRFRGEPLARLVGLTIKDGRGYLLPAGHGEWGRHAGGAAPRPDACATNPTAKSCERADHDAEPAAATAPRR